jgi:hypothetical protein
MNCDVPRKKPIPMQTYAHETKIYTRRKSKIKGNIKEGIEEKGGRY